MVKKRVDGMVELEKQKKNLKGGSIVLKCLSHEKGKWK
jgi:hypothetical protein